MGRSIYGPAEWRTRINDLDSQILLLLNQRAEAALQIGDLKRRQEAPTYVPEREVAIVRRLIAANGGPLSSETVEAVWREILSGCRALEGSLAVAYLGPPPRSRTRPRCIASAPAWSCGPCARSRRSSRRSSGGGPVRRRAPREQHRGCRQRHPRTVSSTPRRSSAASSFSRRPAPALSRARRERDQARALASSRYRAVRGWLTAATLPEVATEETPSTAAAAEVAASDPSVAAIASELAGAGCTTCRCSSGASRTTAQRHALLVIGREPIGPSGRDKTAILFAMKNEPGIALHASWTLRGCGLNLTKIESRPPSGAPGST